MESVVSASLVEPFTGRNPKQSPARWIKSVALNTWRTVSAHLSFIACRLVDDAAEWADTNPEIRTLLDKTNATALDYDTFKTRFLTRWQSQTFSTQPFTDSGPVVQGSDESIPDFYRRVLGKLLLVGGRDSDSIDASPSSRANAYVVQQHVQMFQDGLRDKVLGFRVGEFRCSTLAAAVTQAVRLHTFYQSHRQPAPIHSPIHRPSVSSQITSPSVLPPPPDLQNLKAPSKNFSKPADVVPPSSTISAPSLDASTSGKSGEPSAWMSNVTCFACGERGHYATQCTSANTLSAEESRRVREFVLSQKAQFASSYGQSIGNGGYHGSFGQSSGGYGGATNSFATSGGFGPGYGQTVVPPALTASQVRFMRRPAEAANDEFFGERDPLRFRANMLRFSALAAEDKRPHVSDATDSESRAPPPKRQELDNILLPPEDTEHEQAMNIDLDSIDSLIKGRPPFLPKSKPAKIRSATMVRQTGQKPSWSVRMVGQT